jgi:SAM-dependent methyltransferase
MYCENQNAIFFDLGCGYGHALAAAAMFDLDKNNYCNFSKIVGIEMMSSKILECQILMKRLNEIVKEQENITLPEIELFEINFLTYDWSMGDIIYVCATCFTADVILQILIKVNELKSGSRFIILDKDLQQFMTDAQPEILTLPAKQKCTLMEVNNKLLLIDQYQCKTTWGYGTTFIYCKQ